MGKKAIWFRTLHAETKAGICFIPDASWVRPIRIT
jgi:hypothetical protein